VLLLLVAMQVPLIPMGGAGRVPLDTWLAARFPGARDVYREHFAVLTQPRRLPVLALFIGVLAAAALSYPRRLGEWLAERVPPLSASGLGMYRFALGSAMFVALRAHGPPPAVPFDLQRSTEWLARQDLIRSLAASPEAGSWVWQAASLALLVFAFGVFPRLALAAAAALLTLFAGVLLTYKSVHDWGLPIVTLWVLVAVPWRDGAGMQTMVARWRKRSGLPVTPVQRGLAVWLPGLTVGAAFAAAAFSKLDACGLEWITAGTVRFHFIEDARQAPVSWGLMLTRADAAAIALSLAAIAIEGAFWLVALTRRPGVRFAFGAAGLALLVGFYLFQGVFWPAWWALFVAFLPWSAVPDYRPAPAAPRGAGVPALQSAVIVLFLLHQIAVSAFRVESEPFVSDFSMYAYTWPSKEAFNDHLRAKTARVELTADGLSSDDFERRLRQVPRAMDVFAEAVRRAAQGDAWSDATRAGVAAVRDEYRTTFGEPLQRVEVRLLERGFDWERHAFEASPRSTRLGTLDLDAERFVDTPQAPEGRP
jgi:hypothetical protein